MKTVVCYLAKNGVRYPIHLWRPKNPEHGDYTTDAAMVLAKALASPDNADACVVPVDERGMPVLRAQFSE